MLEIAGSIELSTTHPALVISVEISRQQASASAQLTLYVGPYMRFVALMPPHRGGQLEVLNSSNVWVVQSVWEES